MADWVDGRDGLAVGLVPLQHLMTEISVLLDWTAARGRAHLGPELGFIGRSADHRELR